MPLHLPADQPHELVSDYPTPDTIEHLYDEQDLQRAIAAYRFFYPTVSMEAIFRGNRELGARDGKELIVLAAGPRHRGFTVNSDTPYAAGVLELRAGPIVIEMPAGPFVALVDDHHQRWLLDMGIPGPDAGRGGHYLVLPPGYTDVIPDDYHVATSTTWLAMIAIRALPQGGDVEAAKEALRQIRIYPLADPDATMTYVDASELAADLSPLRWETELEYWRVLHDVLAIEPALEEFRPMYGTLAALGIDPEHDFAPDERMQAILTMAAKAGLDQMRVEAFASHRPDRIVWTDRQWEWVGLVPDDANFETAGFLDLQARDRWFFQAIVTSPAMFRRKAGGGSIYFLANRDREGAYLDGGVTYRLSIPAPVPASLFWSVTVYDARTRSQVTTPQDRAVLGSLHDDLPPGQNGKIDIYVGPSAPAGAEDRWIRTEPGTGVFLYFRIYGPEEAALDGSWQLADLVAV